MLSQIRLRPFLLARRHPRYLTRPASLPVTARAALGQPSRSPPAVKGSSPGPSGDADAFFKLGTAPVPFLGSAAVVRCPGRGHGLSTTKALAPGELLLVSPPLVVIGREDLELSNNNADNRNGNLIELKFAALQGRMLAQQYTQPELTWIRALTEAPEPDESDDPDDLGSREGPLPDLATLISRSVPTEDQRMVILPDVYSQRLAGVIQVNAFEAGSEDTDLAYIALEAEPRAEVMGLWPQYAMLNHSCTPNTVSYAHSSMLITRASRPGVGKGAELTTNYVGDLLLAPLHVRREALRNSYGFVCGCTRCKDEERLPDNMAKLMADIYEACTEQVRQDLEAAIEESNICALQGLRDQLASFVEVLDLAFCKRQAPDRTQIWIQASLFEMYELLNTTLNALGQPDVRLLELLQALAGEVMPGSELHCLYARRLLEAAQDADELGGRPGPATSSGGSNNSKHADGLCYKAYSARYGPISRRVFQSILGVRRRMEDMRSDSEGGGL